jgi:hypothetical protein
MSVLHDRIMAQGTAAAPARPWGTAATPLAMPLAVVTYGADGQALYGTITPLYASDGAVIAGQSHSSIAAPAPAPVVPAGRP